MINDYKKEYIKIRKIIQKIVDETRCEELKQLSPEAIVVWKSTLMSAYEKGKNDRS